MFNIILYQPEIPPNTGNIIRLCANTGSNLHLIEPLGFSLAAKQLRRAGLDYHDLAHIQLHENIDKCLKQFTFERIFALSTKGETCYTTPQFQPQDTFLLGPETSGLSQEILAKFPPSHILHLPQRTTTRSLNLSNVVAIMLYEAWRQSAFI